MLKYRLNKNRIEEEMVKKGLNLTSLARLLGFSLPLTHYALNHGGASFAPKLAAVLGIEPESIIISVRKGAPRQDYQSPLTLTTGGEDVTTSATAKRVKPAPKKKSAAKPAKKIAKKK